MNNKNIKVKKKNDKDLNKKNKVLNTILNVNQKQENISKINFNNFNNIKNYNNTKSKHYNYNFFLKF